MTSQHKYKNILTSLLKKMLQQLLIYKHRYRSRRALLVLDDRMLKDIGIDKESAKQEGGKYFWQGSSEVFDKTEYQRLKHKLLVKPSKSRGVSF